MLKQEHEVAKARAAETDKSARNAKQKKHKNKQQRRNNPGSQNLQD
jgi:hypothetical protein